MSRSKITIFGFGNAILDYVVNVQDSDDVSSWLKKYNLTPNISQENDTIKSGLLEAAKKSR